jgi:hypothetical protein
VLIVRARKRRSMKVITPASGTQGVGERRGEVRIILRLKAEFEV